MWEVMQLTMAFMAVALLVLGVSTFIMLAIIGWLLALNDEREHEKWKKESQANSTRPSGTR